MKTIMVAAILLGFAAGAKAQNNTLLIYGNAGYASEKNDAKLSSYSFRPGIGYQFTDNWTAGINVGVWGDKRRDDGGYVKNNHLEAGPFIRYAYPLGSVFAVYGQMDVNYLHHKQNNTVANTTFRSNGVAARIWPALAANVYKGLALNFKFGEIGYTTEKTKEIGNKSHRFLADFNWTTGFQFGISKNFSWNKK
jgi:hypothetical protein